MHKKFYASGFLFHPPTQQILLHQVSPEELSLFSVECQKDETALEAFRRTIKEQLRVKLHPDHIYQIYNYSNPETNEFQHVFYGEISEQIDTEKKNKKLNAGWFNFKKLYKTKLNKNLLQDLVVGQRVINAAFRLNQ